MKKGNFILLKSLICLFPFVMFSQNEANFFTPPATAGTTVTITNAPYNANGTDTKDDSQALKDAIRFLTTAPNNGGTIIIPKGNFYFFQIVMKSNIHIQVSSEATLRTLPNNGGTSLMFDFNARNSPTIENTSIIGIGGRFTVDFSEFGVDTSSGTEVEDAIRFISCSNVTNFKFSNITILDNFTKFPSISFNVTKDETGTDRRPDKGLIQNIVQTNANYGYGIAQLQSAANLLFKDLDCTGGVTLRLESGNETTAVSDLKMDRIFGRNITSKIGQAALQLSPHTDDHGIIDVRNIMAIDSEFAVKVDPGFLNARDLRNGRTETGSFDSASKIRNVTAITTEADTSIRRQFLRLLPCQYRPEVKALDINPSNSVIIGKSLAPALNTAAYKLISTNPVTYSNNPADFTPNDGHYKIDFSDNDVTATGYLFFIPNVLKFETDDYENCLPIDPSLGFEPFIPAALRNTPHSIDGADPLDGSEPVLSIGNLVKNTVSNFEIYPNPVNDRISIKNNKPIALDLFTISGQLINRYVFKNGQNNSLQINSLSKGTYILRAESEGTATTRIFIKN